MKEYICTIDHSKFSSQEQLVDYIISNYTMSQELGDKYSEMIKRLQQEFPEAIVTIKTVDNTQKNSKSHFNLLFEEYGASFDFAVGDDDFYGGNKFESLDEAIEKHKKILSIKDDLIQAITVKFKPEKVEIHQIFLSDHYGEDSIDLSLFINGEAHNVFYEFEGIEEFLRSIDGKFLESVEGTCKLDYGRFESANTIYVDGVDIKDLAKRAKRLKVEITEYK